MIEYDRTGLDEGEIDTPRVRERIRAAALDYLIAKHPDRWEQLGDHPQQAGWFVGQVMKLTNGSASPIAIQEEIRQRRG